MILFPNAKVNLGLYVGETLPNGYHKIVTAMVPVTWTDILEAVPSTSGQTTLTVTGNALPCPVEKNIVMRAALLYQSLVPEAIATDIYLEKVIPDGAGMGGGSADASFALRLLNDLNGNPLSEEQLEDAAARLGSDCPLFIKNRPALATGTGTDLEPLVLPHLRGKVCVGVKPPKSVSTAQAYAGVKASRRSREQLLEELSLPLEEWRDVLSNDFEQSVGAQVPEILEIKQSLYDLGAVYASMSGSGSAVFGIFETDKLADDATLAFSAYACRRCNFVLD